MNEEIKNTNYELLSKLLLMTTNNSEMIAMTNQRIDNLVNHITSLESEVKELKRPQLPFNPNRDRILKYLSNLADRENF